MQVNKQTGKHNLKTQLCFVSFFCLFVCFKIFIASGPLLSCIVRIEHLEIVFGQGSVREASAIQSDTKCTSHCWLSHQSLQPVAVKVMRWSVIIVDDQEITLLYRPKSHDLQFISASTRCDPSCHKTWSLIGQINNKSLLIIKGAYDSYMCNYLKSWRPHQHYSCP